MSVTIQDLLDNGTIRLTDEVELGAWHDGEPMEPAGDRPIDFAERLVNDGYGYFDEQFTLSFYLMLGDRKFRVTSLDEELDDSDTIVEEVKP